MVAPFSDYQHTWNDEERQCVQPYGALEPELALVTRRDGLSGEIESQVRERTAPPRCPIFSVYYDVFSKA